MATRHRRDVTQLTTVERKRLRQLLDAFIASPTDPVGEHHMAGGDPNLDIHGADFLIWHQMFLSKCEVWMLHNASERFVPLPYWNPKNSVPTELNNGNATSVNVALPAGLKPLALRSIRSYSTLNTRMLPYHASVHNQLGGNMPNPHQSPADPIFWSFHAYLLSLFDQWKVK